MRRCWQHAPGAAGAYTARAAGVTGRMPSGGGGIVGEYGINQSVRRFEDARLLTGGGDYVADGNAHGQLHGVMVRSPYGHAAIRNIDAAAALAAPGVAAVVTGRDYADLGWGPIPHVGPAVKRRGGADLAVPEFWPVAVDRVRMVGEGVAFIVAETADQARDAGELVGIEYEQLPAVSGAEPALATGAPALWPAIGDNEALVHEIGDRAATDAAFATAHHVVARRFDISRVLANAMEPRACLAAWNGRADHYTLRAPVQHPWMVRRILAARILGVDELQVRVITPDVGGSFGIRSNIYPEYLAALAASRLTGRPVKWTGDRSEGFVSDYHGRDNIAEAALALDADGGFRGFRLRNLVDIGAYFSPMGAGPATNNLGTLSGVYTTPVSHVEVVGVFTNSHPTAPYRGAGRPEAAYIIECLVDEAARELDFDPVELRRRNIIPPSAMPFKTALTFTYDSGEFEKNMDDAVRLVDREGFPARRAASEASGRLRGLGFAYAIERAAPPGLEAAEIRFDPGGTVTVLSGTTQQGQGHVTMYTQLLCSWLGIEPDRVRVIQGDTDRLAFGQGAGGSRSSAMGTAALQMAKDKVIAKGCELAAHLLEAAVDDIVFADGEFTVAGTDRSLPLGEIVRAAFSPGSLPDGIEPGLSAHAVYRGSVASYPNGCHACEVEIDPETGAVELLQYAVVDDFGTVLNPLMVKGQVHGGVAQGLGQITLENAVYGVDGQLLTASFMDYGMPRADDMCGFAVVTNPVPTTANPLGVKGAGEAGTVGAMPCVMNAIRDALTSAGAEALDMPATPARVWSAIQAAKDTG